MTVHVYDRKHLETAPVMHRQAAADRFSDYAGRYIGRYVVIYRDGGEWLVWDGFNMLWPALSDARYLAGSRGSVVQHIASPERRTA